MQVWHRKGVSMKETKKPKLDLSRDKCHVCGRTVIRNMEEETQKCIQKGCQIRNVTFSIPYVQEEK